MKVWVFLSFVITAAYAFMLLRYLKSFTVSRSRASLNNPVFISVLIPVRNEAEHLPALLQSILRQDYPAALFEVVVIDDHSEDNTVAVAGEYIKHHEQMRIIHAEGHSKKAAITEGVNAAKGTFIITTDADCVVPEGWLTAFATCFEATGASMITGPVKISPAVTFIQRFQQLDYMALQVTGLASVATAYPLMCSGANLAFTRQSFFSCGGYGDNMHTDSGDDTFLMLKMVQKGYKIKPLIDQDAIVGTAPAAGLAALLNQRSRWTKKIRHYDVNYIKAAGLAVLAANSVFIINLFLAFTGCTFALWLLIMIKAAVDLIVLWRGSRFFSVALQPLHVVASVIFYPFFMLLVLLRKQYEWKGRRR